MIDVETLANIISILTAHSAVRVKSRREIKTSNTVLRAPGDSSMHDVLSYMYSYKTAPTGELRASVHSHDTGQSGQSGRVDSRLIHSARSDRPRSAMGQLSDGRIVEAVLSYAHDRAQNVRRSSPRHLD